MVKAEQLRLRGATSRHHQRDGNEENEECPNGTLKKSGGWSGARRHCGRVKVGQPRWLRLAQSVTAPRLAVLTCFAYFAKTPRV